MVGDDLSFEGLREAVARGSIRQHAPIVTNKAVLLQPEC